MCLLLLLSVLLQQSTLSFAFSFNNVTGLLSYVNELRSRHGVPFIAYSASLESGAQAWATHLASINQLVHSSSSYGENLAAILISWSLTRAIDLWYQEGVDYNYSNPMYNSSTGHFTALVWSKTASIGLGYGAVAGSTLGFYSMWFDPPGNVYGQFLANVKPLLNRSPTSETYVPLPPSPSPSPKPNPLPLSLSRPIQPMPPMPIRYKPPSPKPSPLLLTPRPMNMNMNISMACKCIC